MGIINIHLFLITVAILLSLGFGWWALHHSFQILGYCSLAIAVGLFFYGLQFIKKVKGMQP